MDAASPLPDPPLDEATRLTALNALALLDSQPEQEFDALVALATDLLGCPTAFLTLVDRDRVWIKAASTPGDREMRRDLAFCDHTIRQNTPMIIDDLAQDPRFRNNPLVTERGIRFYAGAPLHVEHHGIKQPIGSLCVIDTAPRCLNSEGRGALAHLAALAESLIAARRTALEAIRIATAGEKLVGELARKDRIFRQAERIAMIGSWRLTVPSHVMEWSDNVYRIHGLPIGAMPSIDQAINFYAPHDRDRVSTAIGASIETGEPFEFEADLITADGRTRRVRSLGEIERVNGVVTAMIGIFQDITDRHAMEVQLRRSADTDALTGIANRAAFDRELDAAMARARRDRSPLLLALIDLDGFKAINDSLGHGAGDDVLRLTGRALSEPWLHGSFCARIGGDEFALIVEDRDLIRQGDELRARIEDVLRIPVQAGGITMTSAGSVGIATFDDDCHSLRDFARRADVILYAAKRSRVGRRQFGAARRAA